MATCTTSQNSPGKNVAVGVALDVCGDSDFNALVYLPLGTINSKQLSYAATTADTTNDQSGATTSEIIVRSGLELAVSGFLTSADSALSAQNALITYYWAEINAGRQPTVWIKISGPDYPRVWHVYMNYKGGDEGFETDSAQTGTFNFGVTDTGTVANLAVNLSAAP